MKAVPTALHRVRGNPSKLNLEGREEREPEPRLTGLDLSAPEHLSAGAKEEWNKKAGMLNRLGLLSEVDLDALSLYCQAWADWKEARRRLAKEGKVKKGKTGWPILNAWLSVERKAAERVARLQGEFGMTPAARTRVTVSKKKGTDAQKERFFGATNPATRPA